MSHYFLYYTVYCEYSVEGGNSCAVCCRNILQRTQDRQHLTLIRTVEAINALIYATPAGKEEKSKEKVSVVYYI
jgi:hypothetical protein